MAQGSPLRAASHKNLTASSGLPSVINASFGLLKLGPTLRFARGIATGSRDLAMGLPDLNIVSGLSDPPAFSITCKPSHISQIVGLCNPTQAPVPHPATGGF